MNAIKLQMRDLDRRITKLDRRIVFANAWFDKSELNMLQASRSALDQRRREVRRLLKARTETNG